MDSKKLIKRILKETFYNYSFSTDLKDIDEQKIQPEFIKMIQNTNEKLKKKKIDKFKFRQRKNSTDMFVWFGNKDKVILKYDELKKYYDKIVSTLAKKSGMNQEEVKKFLNKNERDAFEYLAVAMWQVDNQ